MPLGRRLVIAGLVSLCLTPRHARAQSGKPFRVGRLSSSSQKENVEAFEQALRDLGWDVGRTLMVDRRETKGDSTRLLPFAKELVALKVDVLVAAGNDAVAAARTATTTIPIVMAVGSAERAGITSVRRPGGNVTGITAFLPELAGKRLQLLKEAVPGARVVAVVFEAGATRDLPNIEAASRSLAVAVRRVPLSVPAELERELEPIGRRRVDALYVLPSADMIDPMRVRIAEFAIRERLPAIGALQSYAEAGFLLSYGANSLAWARRSAYFVDRILRGTPAGELPIEQPTTFELVVNLKTARALGFTVPAAVRARADRVID